MAGQMSNEEYLEKINSLGIEVNEKYRGSKNKIRHTCPKCRSTEWLIEPGSILYHGVRMCGICANNIPSTVDYIERAANIGIKVIGKYTRNDKAIEHECPICKRQDWITRPRDILSGKSTKCGNCSGRMLKEPEEYEKQANALGVFPMEKYINATTPIKHKCTVCGREDWKVTPHAVLHGTSKCEICNNSRVESKMATALKQVLTHEYEDTICEYDAGFRGPKGGRSCYDIYVKSMELLIECQSEYHDEYEQHMIDIMKKEYAIENGYKYIALDYRDYTPLQAIQLFFNEITEVPSYVRYDKSTRRNWNVEKAQELLNTGKTYKETAEEVGTTLNAISACVKRGEIIQIDESKLVNRNNRTIIKVDSKKSIQVYNTSEYRYPYLGEYRKSRVIEACNSESHKYKRCRWYFKEDWDKLNKSQRS